MSAVEEEVELRDLVAQTLELNGCLPKIRAQLRANLFLALDEDTKISKQQPLLNNKIKSHMEAPEGQLMFCLVREFLEYFNLDFTISVYESESYLGSCYKYEGRQKIINDLGLKNVDDNLSGPVLLQLVKIAQKRNTLNINLTNVNGAKSDGVKESTDSSNTSSIHDKINGQCNVLENEHSDRKCTSSNILEKKNIENIYITGKQPLDSTYTKKDLNNDDTFNGTSSIEEEITNGTDNIETNEKSSEEEHLSSSESKSKSEERVKIPQKCDKLKSKLDIPPLQLNKSRGSDILPSLYNKDFKEKNKDFELNFYIKDDYEEDFMSGSEAEFSLSKVDCPKPLLDELQSECSKTTSNTLNLPNSITARNKSLSSDGIKEEKGINSDNKSVNNTNSTNGTTTSLNIGSEIANTNHTSHYS